MTRNEALQMVFRTGDEELAELISQQAAQLATAEQQARENAEKAALLEWMFSNASIAQALFSPEFVDECVALIKSQATSPEDMEDILKWGIHALQNRRAAKEAADAK